MADIFREQVDLDARMRAVGEIVALAAAVHRPIVRRFRHIGDNGGVDVVRKDAVEHEMIKWSLKSRRRIHRRGDEIAQALNRKLAVAGL